MEKMSLKLDSNIQYLKGVGPATAEKLNKLGIYTLNDLIENFPRMYEDRTKLYRLSELEIDKNCLFIGTISSKKEVKRIRKNLIIYSNYVCDETAVIKMTWFNQKYVAEKLIPGNSYLFFGKPEYQNGRICVEGASIYSVNDLQKIQGVYPIYNLTSGITQNYMFKIENLAMSYIGLIKEIFDDDFKRKYDLIDIQEAIKKIHFPDNFDDVAIARKRLIFEELFLFQLALLSVKEQNSSSTKKNYFEKVDENEFLKLLPFELTNAQKRVIEEIKGDIYSDKVMNRLVQGDVGCGKTMVAAVSIYIAVKNGYQTALMAPTTILANQHYSELTGYFKKLGITCDIITSSTTKKKKKDIIDRLKLGMIDVLIGTHSLIEENIEFKNLGLFVTDEQHRFGVKQRLKLTSKSESVETLVMSATPIPRTLAIILYGDLDLSIIDQMPPGRTPIKTFVLDDSYEARINNFIRKQINSGRQVYIVCPLVEENEELDLKSVERIYQKYKEELFSDLNVEFLHGKMKNKEKDDIMTRFKNNQINILISTTVIEVGISVSNATLMVIENADRFGLAALHQLRGRVGRGDKESFCILKSNNKSVVSRKRLKIMEQSNDGFEIARKDLEIRGPGDFFGIRQSGLPAFKIADLLNDTKILEMTTKAVKEVIEDDKKLEKNKIFKDALNLKFGDYIKNISG